MSSSRLRFLTLSGIPIEITDLKWPFHQSTSGSDWFILHGRVDLLESPEKLHAEVAVGMTQTMKEAIGSLEPQSAEGMVVNAIRKTFVTVADANDVVPSLGQFLIDDALKESAVFY